MTTLYAIAGLAMVAGLAIWFAIRSAKKQARAEVLADEAKALEKANQVIAEHRDPKDAINRLDGSTF